MTYQRRTVIGACAAVVGAGLLLVFGYVIHRTAPGAPSAQRLLEELVAHYKGRPHLTGWESLLGEAQDRCPAARDTLRHVGSRRRTETEIANDLAKRGSSVVDLLAQQAGDKDLDRRLVAARVLGLVGGDQAIDVLVGLLKDPEPRVKAMAIWGLLRVGGERAVTALIAQLDDTMDMSVLELWRGGRGPPIPNEPLVRQEVPIRAFAAQGLGLLGDERAIPALRRASRDRDAVVAATASEALRRLLGTNR